jgi:hypothetical protein
MVLLVAGGALVAAAVGFLVVLVSEVGDESRGASLTAETARAGQCVDLDEEGSRIDLVEIDCTSPHDAEIVLTTEFGEAYAQQNEDISDAEGVCSDLLSDAEVARLTAYDGELAWGLLIDDPSNVDGFDRLVCYVRDAGGRLSEPLL